MAEIGFNFNCIIVFLFILGRHILTDVPCSDVCGRSWSISESYGLKNRSPRYHPSLSQCAMANATALGYSFRASHRLPTVAYPILYRTV